MNLQKLLVQSLLWRGLYFITTLLVNVLLSRYLQASATGVVYYLSNIFSFSLIILSVSLESGITYFASGNMVKPSKLIWLAVAWSFVVSLLVIVLVYGYITVDASIPAGIKERYYAFGICYLTGLFLTNCGAALFYAQNNFFLPNLVFTLWNICLIIFIPKDTVSPGLQESIPTLNLYFLVFFLQGVTVCMAYLFKNKGFADMSLPAKQDIILLFRYSGLATLANIVFFLVYRIDYLFVNASPVCTDADLGNYIQVSKLGQMLLIIPQILASVIFPRTASGIDRKELNTTIMIMARLFLQLYVVVLVLVALAGHWMFTWLFGATFDAMKLPFIILIPGIFSLSVLTLLAAYFSGKGKVKVNIQGTIIALVVVVVGDYLFVPRYGIIAAAAVSTVGYTVNLGYELYVFYKDYDINLFDFFRWRKEDYRWVKELLFKKL